MNLLELACKNVALEAALGDLTRDERKEILETLRGNRVAQIDLLDGYIALLEGEDLKADPKDIDLIDGVIDMLRNELTVIVGKLGKV